MAIVLPGSFIFLAHMYTGSEVIARALKKIDGAFPAYDKRRGIGHHATLDQVKQVCKDKLTGTEKVFTVVRNPYDTLSCMYFANKNHSQFGFLEERLKRDGTFRDFIELWVEMNLHPYMVEKRLFYQEAQECLRYERLQVELDTLLRRTPGAPGSLKLDPFDELPDKDHWSLFYDDPTYAYVNEQFRDDIVKFGYPFIWSNDKLA